MILPRSLISNRGMTLFEVKGRSLPQEEDFNTYKRKINTPNKSIKRKLRKTI
jgi:hypothetical protein